MNKALFHSVFSAHVRDEEFCIVVQGENELVVSTVERVHSKVN